MIRNHDLFEIDFEFTQIVRQWIAEDESVEVGRNPKTKSTCRVIAPNKEIALAWFKKDTEHSPPDAEVLEVRRHHINAFIELHTY